jgi:hypothetical protein
LIAEILAVQPEQIEDSKHDAVTIAKTAERALKRRETRQTFFVGNEGFAVDNGLDGIETCNCLDDGREAIGPIVEVAGDLTVAEIDANPIAVSFDLMQPVRPVPDPVDQRGMHRREDACRNPWLVPRDPAAARKSPFRPHQ